MPAPGRTLRIGILGAARIAPTALLAPARARSDLAVTAVAARDETRARQFARRYAIATVHTSYQELIDDPDIDAIYNPLPNGLHGRWTQAAIAAGKHVLCEKPFAANATEAAQVAAAAERSRLVVMEAFHYRYHALIPRLLELLSTGELGEIEQVEAWFCIPLLAANIRWQWDLAGGAMMDLGCYTIHLLRTLMGTEPSVLCARAKLRSSEVDRSITAELQFPPRNATGRAVKGVITASMLSWRLLSVGARVAGSRGTLEIFNPYAPQHRHHMTVRTARGVRHETVPKQPSSYSAQLETFANAVLQGTPYPTDCADAVANMRVVDACYTAAGLRTREPSLT